MFSTQADAHLCHRSKNSFEFQQQPIQCVICYRKAQYHHYNVPACQGCGFFFKRCIFKEKFNACCRRGTCLLDDMGVLILQCRACRFDKCILVGMSLEAMHFSGVSDLTMEVAKRRIIERRTQLMASGWIVERKIGENVINIRRSRFPGSGIYSSDGDLLFPLMPIERAYHRIWNSPNLLCKQYANRHPTLRQLVEDGGNLLATSTKYLIFTPNSFYDKAALIAEVDANGAFSCNYMSQTMVKDWFLSVELAKAMPFFKRLNLEDQIHQLKHVFEPICSLFAAYYAHAISAKTVIRGNGYTPISLVETARFYGDKKIRATYILYMVEMVERMGQCGIEYREFLLLFAVLIASSNAENLSQQGRELLYAESVRYSKALLKMLQTKLGVPSGSAKFASLLKLMEIFFSAKHKFDDLMAYIEVFYERKDPKLWMPKAIGEMVIGGAEQ